MYVLDDGSVLVAGEFAYADPPEYSGTPDYGFVVVDPESGESRTTSVVPAGETDNPTGTATLSADGRTLYVYVSNTSGGARRLLAVDVASGESSPSTTSRETR